MGRIPKVEKEKALLACRTSEEGCVSMGNQTDHDPNTSVYNKANLQETESHQPGHGADAYKHEAETTSACDVVDAIPFPYSSTEKLDVVDSSLKQLAHKQMNTSGQYLETKSIGQNHLTISIQGVDCLRQTISNDLAIKSVGDSVFVEKHRIHSLNSSHFDHINVTSPVVNPPTCTLTSSSFEKFNESQTMQEQNYQQFHQRSPAFHSQCRPHSHRQNDLFSMGSHSGIPSEIDSIPEKNSDYACLGSQFQGYSKHELAKISAISTISTYASDRVRSVHSTPTLEKTIATPVIPLVPPHTTNNSSCFSYGVNHQNMPGESSAALTKVCTTVSLKFDNSNHMYPDNYFASTQVCNSFVCKDTSFQQTMNSELSHNGNHTYMDNEDNEKSMRQTEINTTVGNEIKQNEYFEKTAIEMKSSELVCTDTDSEMKPTFANTTSSETNENEYFNITREMKTIIHAADAGNTLIPVRDTGTGFISALEQRPLLTSIPLCHEHPTRCLQSPTATASISNYALSTASTSSSHRSRYSPGLIKILLEQVIDMTQNKDIAEKLKLKLKQNKTDPTVVAEILSLIGEVVKKRPNSLSQSDTASSGFSDSGMTRLAENKMERMQKFLNDVEMYSINQALILKLKDSSDFQMSSDSGKGMSNQISSRHEHTLSFSETQNVKFSPDDDNQGCRPLPQSAVCDLQTELTQQVICLQQQGSTTNAWRGNEAPSKDQQLQGNLDRLQLAMRILCRLAPEHREKLRLWKSGQIHLRVMTDSDSDVKETFKKVVEGIPLLSERIMGFCQEVPGFTELNVHDRAVLMKRAYYDIWMLHTSESFSGGEVNIILGTGEIYSRSTMTKILNKEMVQHLLTFAEEFNALQLNDLEISTLCAVQLMNTDKLDLVDKAATDNLHSLMVDVLRFVIRQNHPGSYTQIMLDIFQLIPALERINIMQKQIIAAFNLDKYGD